jgi:hypothetical protein
MATPHIAHMYVCFIYYGEVDEHLEVMMNRRLLYG